MSKISFISSIMMLLLICSIFSVFAADTIYPKIDSFKAANLVGGGIELDWTISDNEKLKAYSIKRDGEHLTGELIPYNLFMNVFVDHETRTGENYTYTLTAMDTVNLSSTKTVKITADGSPPKVLTENEYYSNQNQLTFVTDESAKCSWEIPDQELKDLEDGFLTNHTIEGVFSQGKNSIVINCIDDIGNEMYSTYQIDFYFDTDIPDKITGLKARFFDNSVELTWEGNCTKELIPNCAFKVYKAGEDSKLKDLAQIKEPFFMDTNNLKLNERYSYAVSLIDLAGNEGPRSDLASVVISDSPIKIELSEPGLLSSDQRKLTINGSTDVKTDIVVKVEGKVYKARSANNFAITFPLRGDEKTIEVEATDKNGLSVSKMITLNWQAKPEEKPKKEEKKKTEPVIIPRAVMQEDDLTKELVVEKSEEELNQTSEGFFGSGIGNWKIVLLVFVLAIIIILAPKAGIGKRKKDQFGFDDYIAKRRK
ncbi:hypothetical protein ACFL0W_03065 [Nanoarchaeota archaeon]